MKHLIWSWEHRQWWAPNGQGYTDDVVLAGRYTAEEAALYVIGHIPPGEEVAVLEAYAMSQGLPPRYGCKDLVADSTALQAAEQDAALCWGTLYEIRDLLIQVSGAEAMEHTPPMMYPEAIASALFQVRQEVLLERGN